MESVSFYFPIEKIEGSRERQRCRPDSVAVTVALATVVPGEAIGLYLFLENLCKTEFPLPDKSKYKTADELATAIAEVHHEHLHPGLQ